MKDRFTESVEELSEKNAFVCESCEIEGDRKLDAKRSIDVEGYDQGDESEDPHTTGLKIGSTRLEKIINSDPTPFGP